MAVDGEKLSPLLDGDSGESCDAAIDAVIDDVNLQYRVRRYRMIGEIMRNELPPAIDTGFHARVMAEIGTSTPARAPRPAAVDALRRWRPLAGLAVAAGVAVVTVALWRPLAPPSSDAAEQVVGNELRAIERLAGQPQGAGAVPASTQIQSLGLRWKGDADAPDLQQKLNAYLVNHTEYSNSVQGLIPQARVAGFDAAQ